MSEAPAVLSEIADGVMTITLNRPERGNAWNRAVSRLYFPLLEQAAHSPEVRAIVITGAGKAFCVGGDGEKLESAAAEGSVKSSVNYPFWYPVQIAKPVIAAVNGACFGMGMQQALCCDLRFASEDARFSTAYAKRGIVAEFGMSWLLPRIVGTGHAMDLLLSARTVRPDEAARIALVNKVVPSGEVLAEAQAYARQLAAQSSPASMRAMKLQCYQDWMSTLMASNERASAMLDVASAAPDFKEGVASWLEGRPPRFPALPADQAFIAYKA